jgi:hypothetical protein
VNGDKSDTPPSVLISKKGQITLTVVEWDDSITLARRERQAKDLDKTEHREQEVRKKVGLERDRRSSEEMSLYEAISNS